MMKAFISLMLVSCAGLLDTSGVFAGESGDAVKGQSVAANCAACHGPKGNNTTSNTIPRLAQQVAPYIVKQLHDFKSGARKNSIMSTMVAMLSDQSMLDVAAYFSSQKIAAGKAGGPSLTEQGRLIYSGGVAEPSVPACASCHGADATGVTPVYPRLAGQHAAYIIAQLKAFRAKERTNDESSVMRDIAARLDDHQMEALAEYLNSI